MTVNIPKKYWVNQPAKTSDKPKLVPTQRPIKVIKRANQTEAK